jgi:MYXO-CTERM domain-containing protein
VADAAPPITPVRRQLARCDSSEYNIECMRVCFAIAVGATQLLFGARAEADAIPPYEELECPDGHTPAVDHGGTYCRPPPPQNCPPGYEPAVRRTTAFCDPPPERPCPAGSTWAGGSCHIAFPSCEDRDCDSGRCVPVSFCLVEPCFRCSYSVVTGTCTSQADCTDNPPSECRRAFVCEPPFENKRKPVDYPARHREYDLPIAAPDPEPLPNSDVQHCPSGQCPEGRVCVPLQWCVDTRQMPGNYPGQYRSPAGAPVTGSCSEGKGCPSDSNCSRAFRCIEAADVERNATEQSLATLDLPQALPGITNADSRARGTTSDSPPKTKPGCSRCSTTGGAAPPWCLALMGLVIGAAHARRTRRS